MVVDDDRGLPGRLQLDRVVHAVGGAAPAVGGAGDHDVGLGEQPLEDVGRARDGGVRRSPCGPFFVINDTVAPVRRGERLGGAGHHDAGVGLAVVEHGDAQPGEATPATARAVARPAQPRLVGR